MQTILAGIGGLFIGSALSLAHFEYPMIARILLASGVAIYVYLGLTSEVVRPRLIPYQWVAQNVQLAGIAAALLVFVGMFFGVKPRLEMDLVRLAPQESENLIQGIVARINKRPEPANTVAPKLQEEHKPIEPAKPSKTPQTTKATASIGSFPFLYLMYAYEWNYLHSTNNDGDMARIITSDTPLKKSGIPNEPQRLDLGLFNPGSQPTAPTAITITLPKELTVEHGGKWVRQEGHTYTYQFPSMDSHGGYHADYPLFLTFPKISGSYQIKYTIKEWAHEAVSSAFRIEVSDASTP